MTVTRVRRVVNPMRKRSTATKKRRKLSPKQIRIFGTKAQKAALKRKRTMARNPHKRRTVARKRTAPRRRRVLAANPRPRKAVRRRRTRRASASNPASVITLGLINPERKRKVAKTKRRRRTTAKAMNPRRRRRRTAMNPVRHRRRSANTHRRRRSRNTRIYVMPRRNGKRRHRNPEVMGVDAMKIFGGLLGVYTTKVVAPLVVNAVPQIGSSPVFTAILQAAIAWGGGMLIGKTKFRQLGEGFAFGGFMQAGSSLLNLVVPANPLSLSGLGDFQPGMFAVPENPIMRAARQRAIAAAPGAGSPSGAGMGAALMFR